MLLFYSPFHRFVHKVLVAIHETGLVDAVELVPTFPFRNVEGVWVEDAAYVGPQHIDTGPMHERTYEYGGL